MLRALSSGLQLFASKRAAGEAECDMGTQESVALGVPTGDSGGGVGDGSVNQEAVGGNPGSYGQVLGAQEEASHTHSGNQKRLLRPVPGPAESPPKAGP